MKMKTSRVASKGSFPRWETPWFATLSVFVGFGLISCKPPEENAQADPEASPAAPPEAEPAAPVASVSGVPVPGEGGSNGGISLSIDSAGSNPTGLTPMDIPGPEGGPGPGGEGAVEPEAGGVAISPNIKIKGELPPGFQLPDFAAMGIGEGLVLEEISIPDLAPGEGPVGPNGEVIDPSTLNLKGVTIPPGGLPMLPSSVPGAGPVEGPSQSVGVPPVPTPEDAARQRISTGTPAPPSEAPPFPSSPSKDKTDTE